MIAINPTLRDQAERLLPLLEQAKRPAEDMEVLRVLIRHAPTYALSTRLDSEWAEFFDVYLDALEGLAVHALEDAFLRWNRGDGMKNPEMGQFFPKPSQLVDLARKSRDETWMAAYRCKKALEQVGQTVDRAPPVDGDVFKNLLADLAKAKKPPEMTRPRLSPQETAQQLREASPDVGDVI